MKLLCRQTQVIFFMAGIAVTTTGGFARGFGFNLIKNLKSGNNNPTKHGLNIFHKTHVVPKEFCVERAVEFNRRTQFQRLLAQLSKKSPGYSRKFSTCFVHPESANEASAAILSSAEPKPSESPPNNHSDSDKERNEIKKAALASLTITGSLPPPFNFGGILYLDTSSLDENQSHRVVFILGGPGAGKGTQSERIVSTYKCVHLSVGELLRSGAERSDYPHAELVKDCLIKGKIVPVELSLGLLRIAMDEKAEAGGGSSTSDDNETKYGSRIFLVDGFPRNYDNVEGWMKHMPSYTAVLGALVYNCPMEVLEQRIMSRAETSGRSDDNLESARKRFDTFRKQTEPVVKALEHVEELQVKENARKGKVGCQLNIVNIDATGTVEEVWEKTEAAMNSYVVNDVLTANMKLLKAVEKNDVTAYADLCDENLFVSVENSFLREGEGVAQIFEELEKPFQADATCVSNASIKFVDGTSAVVSYERKLNLNGSDGVKSAVEVREWKHRPKGWICIKFSRQI